MRKTALAPTLVLLLSFFVVAGAQFTSQVKANPYSPVWLGQRSAPSGVQPPVISILEPKSNSTIMANNVLFSFDVSLGEVRMEGVYLREIYYMGDWQKNKTYVEITPYLGDLHVQLNLTGVPEGDHKISVYAAATGSVIAEMDDRYKLPGKYWNFSIDSASSVFFSIKLPKILEPAKYKTCNTSDVSLIFTIGREVPQIAYSLDGQDNVTVAGNTTLTGLSNGLHNVTVCAWDMAGNVGASEIIFFTVEVPFPLVPVAAAVAVIAVGAVAGLLLYFKKRKHQEKI